MSEKRSKKQLHSAQIAQPSATRTMSYGWLGLYCFWMVLLLGLYFPALNAPFFFDDQDYIVDMPNPEFGIDIRDLSTTLQAFGNSLLLPGKSLTYVTFALNYAVHELSPWGYRGVNLVLHWLTTLNLMYFLRFRLSFSTHSRSKLPVSALSKKSTLKSPPITWLNRVWPEPQVVRILSALLATLFLVHPLAVNSVTYVSQRSGLFAACLCLLSLNLADLVEVENIKLRRRIYFIAAILIWILATKAKAIALILPLIWGLLKLQSSWNDPLLRKIWLQSGAILSLLLGLGGVVYAYKIQLFSQNSLDVGFATPGLWSAYEHILTEAQVFLRYLQLWWWPWPSWLSLHHEFPLSHQFTEIRVLIAFLSHGLIVFLIFHSWRSRWPLISLGLLWFYAALVPPYLWIPQKELMVEYKTYFPSVGLILIIAHCCLGLLQKQRIAWVIGGFTVVLLVLSAITWQRNTILANPISIWSNVLTRYPDSERALQNRAEAHLQFGQITEALNDLTRLLKINGNNQLALINRAQIYFNLKDYARAQEDLERARELWLTLPDVLKIKTKLNGFLYLRAKNLMRLQQFKAATLAYDEYLFLHNDDVLAYADRATCLTQLGRYVEALRDIQRALLSEPNNVHFLSNSGNIYALQGQTQQALKTFHSAIQLNPQHAPSYYNLALLYDQMAKLDQARSMIKMALTIEPMNSQYQTLSQKIFALPPDIRPNAE